MREKVEEVGGTYADDVGRKQGWLLRPVIEQRKKRHVEIFIKRTPLVDRYIFFPASGLK